VAVTDLDLAGEDQAQVRQALLKLLSSVTDPSELRVI
jgi:hypothetical protein